MRRTEKYGWVDETNVSMPMTNAERLRQRQAGKLAEVRANNQDPKRSGRHSAE